MILGSPETLLLLTNITNLRNKSFMVNPNQKGESCNMSGKSRSFLFFLAYENRSSRFLQLYCGAKLWMKDLEICCFLEDLCSLLRRLHKS